MTALHLEEPLCLCLKAYFTWEGVFHSQISAAIYMEGGNDGYG